MIIPYGNYTKIKIRGNILDQLPNEYKKFRSNGEKRKDAISIKMSIITEINKESFQIK